MQKTKRYMHQTCQSWDQRVQQNCVLCKEESVRTLLTLPLYPLLLQTWSSDHYSTPKHNTDGKPSSGRATWFSLCECVCVFGLWIQVYRLLSRNIWTKFRVLKSSCSFERFGHRFVLVPWNWWFLSYTKKASVAFGGNVDGNCCWFTYYWTFNLITYVYTWWARGSEIFLILTRTHFRHSWEMNVDLFT